MNFYEAQKILFAERPARMALLALPAGDTNDATEARPLRINVWRNHAIESIMSLAQPYFAWAHLATELHIGHYDDSLQFDTHEAADVELIWLDPSRYDNEAEWLTWLAERLRALRTMSDAPIVLATWASAAGGAELQALADQLPGVRFADILTFAKEAGLPLLDARTATASGTPIASALHALLARKLVCHWLAGCALPSIKAVAVDLDNTLHAGVLGEDGPHGVVLMPGHIALQTALKSLRARGVFLSLVSRNDFTDVQALFVERHDYPLRWEDFSAIEVSWGTKVDALRRIALQLNIGTNAMVFVDDNLGELLNVATALPEMRSVFAEADADLTQRVVTYVPGLWRWKTGADDAVRIADLNANQQRAAMLKNARDPSDYFRDLQVTLQWRVDPMDQLDRLADLCSKTNQFNLSVRRFKHAELSQSMQSPLAHVVSVRMRDRLADSGVVAVIVTRRDGSQLIVEELCISCRALGRGLEDTMILAVVQHLPLFEGCTELVMQVAHGPRNQPALQWLARVMGDNPSHGALPAGEHSIAADRVRDFAAPSGLMLSSGDFPHEP